MFIRYINNKRVKVFEWSSSREFMYLTVNSEGEVESIYSYPGNTTCMKGDAYFNSSVNFFMRKLLEADVVEFLSMRESLNSEWYKVSENIRNYVVNKYNFWGSIIKSFRLEPKAFYYGKVGTPTISGRRFSIFTIKKSLHFLIHRLEKSLIIIYN